jgi:hypothetical protein
MASMEERLKVLTMVQEGKITPEQAAQLLEAITPSAPPPPPGPAAHRGHVPHPGFPEGSDFSEAPAGLGRKPRWLRVRVTDTNTGRPRVNVRLPVSMVNMGLKMGSRFAPQVEGLDADQLMKIIESGEIGQIVDVFDEQDGEHVEVFLE